MELGLEAGAGAPWAETVKELLNAILNGTFYKLQKGGVEDTGTGTTPRLSRGDLQIVLEGKGPRGGTVSGMHFRKQSELFCSIKGSNLCLLPCGMWVAVSGSG